MDVGFKAFFSLYTTGLSKCSWIITEMKKTTPCDIISKSKFKLFYKNQIMEFLDIIDPKHKSKLGCIENLTEKKGF